MATDEHQSNQNANSDVGAVPPPLPAVIPPSVSVGRPEQRPAVPPPPPSGTVPPPQPGTAPPPPPANRPAAPSVGTSSGPQHNQQLPARRPPHKAGTVPQQIAPPQRKSEAAVASGLARAQAIASETLHEKRSGGRRWWKRRFKRPATPGAKVAEQEAARRQMPSWLVSLIFHLALLLILALIPLSDLSTGPLTLFFGEGTADGSAEFELLGAEMSQTQLENESEALTSFESVVDPNELLQVELPEVVVRESVSEMSATVDIENLPFGISNGLKGRTGAMKGALLSQFGGTAETEAAVELGLAWLAKQQKSNGSWSLIGPYSRGGASENTTAATAMAVNAFLGAGYTHKEGKYAREVKLGLAYLVRRQDSEGFFSKREPSRQQMYAQAIATIAVTEAYGMSQDEELRIAAQKALSYAEWSQSPLQGWRYEPREDADLSVTGWFVMALITGKMAGLVVDDDKLQSVTKFLDSVSHEGKTRYAYSEFEPPSLSMTAEGLLCRIYLGWPRSDPALLAALRDDLLPSVPRTDQQEYSVYFWYYATQVMHHVGGMMWDEWNQAMRKTIPAMQEKAGVEAGSWDPSNDMFGASGGRLYTTCLNIYCLEVYYRHLSIYDLAR